MVFPAFPRADLIPNCVFEVGEALWLHMYATSGLPSLNSLVSKVLLTSTCLVLVL